MTGPILVVDDYDDLRATFCEELRDEGYEVVEASNGRNALHYLTSDEPLPSLMVLDLQMPELSGWDLLTIMHSYVRLSAMPVIVLSGTHPQARSFPQGQVARFLRKPVDARLLRSAVTSILGAPVVKVARVHETA